MPSGFRSSSEKKCGASCDVLNEGCVVYKKANPSFLVMGGRE